jgi:cellulose biosynthesis protein BcsQ
MLRDTFADTSGLQYRLRAAGTLLGVTDNTLRGYADNAGIPVKRASDITPGSPAVRVFEPETLFRLAQWRRAQGYTKSPSRQYVITVDVIKGGTGKTTTAVELALHLQFLGLRCLLIDLDIQANATQMMGYEPDLTPDETSQYGVTENAIVTHTFSHILIPFIESQTRGGGLRLTGESPASIIKMPFGEAGPHLVPADTFLGDVEQTIASARGTRELYIRQLLDKARSGEVPGFDIAGYDVILFDCPPSVSFTSTAALAAADFVVAPIRLDAFSVKGLIKLMREIDVVDKTYGVRPELVILPTHYAPQLTRIGRMQTQLQQHYRDLISPSAISVSEDFPRSIDNYLPLTMLKPTSNASREYRVFAEFMLGKMIGRRP